MVFSINVKKLIISLIIPLGVGALSAFITRNDMDIYSAINTPALAPPGWIFPVVWTVLYILMGISLYLVWNSNAPYYKKQNAITVFILQLILNFIWSPIFFSLQRFLLAFFVLILMWIFTLAMIITFYKINKIAGVLQIPYLIWLTFAGYLNLSIYLMN